MRKGSGSISKVVKSKLSLYSYGYQGHNGMYEILAPIVIFCQAILVFVGMFIKVIMACHDVVARAIRYCTEPNLKSCTLRPNFATDVVDLLRRKCAA